MLAKLKALKLDDETTLHRAASSLGETLMVFNNVDRAEVRACIELLLDHMHADDFYTAACLAGIWGARRADFDLLSERVRNRTLRYRDCARCRKVTDLKCAGCLQIAVCGEKCRKKLWQAHKARCHVRPVETYEHLFRAMAFLRHNESLQTLSGFLTALHHSKNPSNIDLGLARLCSTDFIVPSVVVFLREKEPVSERALDIMRAAAKSDADRHAVDVLALAIEEEWKHEVKYGDV